MANRRCPTRLAYTQATLKGARCYTKSDTVMCCGCTGGFEVEWHTTTDCHRLPVVVLNREPIVLGCHLNRVRVIGACTQHNRPADLAAGLRVACSPRSATPHPTCNKKKSHETIKPKQP